MSAKKAPQYRPGDKVVLIVLCDKMHAFDFTGEVTTDGHAIRVLSPGKMRLPGESSDPTCCPKCGMRYTQVLMHGKSEEAGA